MRKLSKHMVPPQLKVNVKYWINCYVQISMKKIIRFNSYKLSLSHSGKLFRKNSKMTARFT